MRLKKSELKNVSFNDDKTGYVVQMPDGKTRAYKTLKGAEKKALGSLVETHIPPIVTANPYFWTPSGSASGRRSNEKRHRAVIDDFCELVNRIPTVYATGSYDESCRNVYKSMSYRVNGHPANLTGLIGECARWGLVLKK